MKHAVTVFAIVLTLISSLIQPTIVAAKPIQRRETNADRMKRGLPPLRPRKLWSASKTAPALAKRSPAPIPTFSGKLEARYVDGTVVGHVRNEQHGFIHGINFVNPSNDLQISFKTNPGQKETFDLTVTNAAFPGPNFDIGFIVSSADQIFKEGDGSSATFGIVPSTSANSVPQPIPDTTPQTYSESNVWMFDQDTRELTAHYTNPDSSNTNIHIPLAYRVRENELLFTPNATAWTQQHSGYFASEVKLYLVNA